MAAPSPVVNPAWGGLKGALWGVFMLQKSVAFQSNSMRSGVLRAGAFTFGLCAAAPSFADDTLPLGWHTEVALGGSLATGNTDHQALDLESKVRYRTEHREDVYRLMGDMARDNGLELLSKLAPRPSSSRWRS